MVDLQKDNVEISEPEPIESPAQGGEPEVTPAQNDSPEPIAFETLETPITIKLEELKEEKEYTDDEFKQFVEMYEDTLSDFVEGELVTGKILAINSKEVAVDIGFKSEGTIPIDEFTDPESLKIGDDIEVFLDEVEDKEGQLVLSKKKADFMRIWDKICKSYTDGDVVQGRCNRRIKGGIVVDLMGIDAFLPGSQIDVRPIRDFDAFIGQTLDLKVVKVNNLRKNIVVSRRILVEAEIAGQRQKILDDLEKGQVLEGSVKNITDFGVFIDLGGVDGLLHINDLSWGRVSHPSEVVALDEKINVMVLDFNEPKDRISLGLKQLQPHPWEKVDEKYPVDSVMRGKVVSISDYGAFIELEKGVEGLIHISEMSWTQHIKHPSKIVTIGETVEAKILNIEKEERKISLGLKQLEPDPWETLEERYPIGSRHEGKVRNLTNFGAFIELEDGIDGLVHISDLSWTKKIRHPSEVLKKGGKIDVVVLNVDRANRRISLGYKQTCDSPWDTFESRFKPGFITNGKVVRLIEKGLIVELPEEVDGFVPISHLAKQVNKPSDGYQIDDTLEVRVIEFNKENKKIVLSERLAKEASDEDVEGHADKKITSEESPAESASGEQQAAPEKTPEETPEKPEEAVAEITPEKAAEETAVEQTMQAEQKDEAQVEPEEPIAAAEAIVEAKAVEIAPEQPEKATAIAEEVTEAAKPETEAVVEEKPQALEEKPEAEAKKKPRKTRKKAEADTGEASLEKEDKPEAKAKKTKKSAKKKVAVETASGEKVEDAEKEAGTDGSPEAEEKPKKRTRKTKKAKAETEETPKAADEEPQPDAIEKADDTTSETENKATAEESTPDSGESSKEA